MKILELYSGIGGMHLALKMSKTQGEIICSIDINETANIVYKHNFPSTKLLNRNIQSLTAKFINDLGVDTILMSPPCQPFTRNGLKKDITDARTCSFMHILDILNDLLIDKILIENVKGFECSEMRDILIKKLTDAAFTFQEFILSPNQLGVPNTRHRYYCLARKGDAKFTNDLLQELPKNITKEPCEISTILQNEIKTEDFALSRNHLTKRHKIIDICYANSKRSCCFTKSYGRYIEGTGSIFTDKNEREVDAVYKELENYSSDSDEFFNCISKLNLRFFTPREVCRLMSFPETFTFPTNITKKQKYMLLGNSLNIKVVSELIKILNGLYL